MAKESYAKVIFRLYIVICSLSYKTRHGYPSPLKRMQANAISHCDETKESEGGIGTKLLPVPLETFPQKKHTSTSPAVVIVRAFKKKCGECLERNFKK